MMTNELITILRKNMYPQSFSFHAPTIPRVLTFESHTKSFATHTYKFESIRSDPKSHSLPVTKQQRFSLFPSTSICTCARARASRALFSVLGTMTPPPRFLFRSIKELHHTAAERNPPPSRYLSRAMEKACQLIVKRGADDNRQTYVARKKLSARLGPRSIRLIYARNRPQDQRFRGGKDFRMWRACTLLL